MSTLHFDCVSKTYTARSNSTQVQAVQSVTTTVRSGEFVSLVGPSGCGKTTLLRMAQGLERPTTGSIMMDGRPVWDKSSRLATVFQSASLLPWFTVRKNVAFGLLSAGHSRRAATARADEFITRVGLTGFADKYPHELSGGMQQRANLARALAVDPQVLLMDEPYAALDPMTREDMQADLLRIWEGHGTTVLLITHQIDEAVFLSDRVLVMSGRPGQILADIAIDLDRPRTLALRADPRFHACVDSIWRLMRAEEGQEISEAPAVAQ